MSWRLPLRDVSCAATAPSVADDLTAVGLRSPEDLLATFVAADETLAAYLGDTPTLTDDRPRLEYHNFYPFDPIRVEDLKRLRDPWNAISASLPPRTGSWTWPAMWWKPFGMSTKRARTGT